MNYKIEIEKLLEAFEPQSNAGVNTYVLFNTGRYKHDYDFQIMYGENIIDAFLNTVRKAYVNREYVFLLYFGDVSEIIENEYDIFTIPTDQIPIDMDPYRLELDDNKVLKHIHHVLMTFYSSHVIEMPGKIDYKILDDSWKKSLK